MGRKNSPSITRGRGRPLSAAQFLKAYQWYSSGITSPQDIASKLSWEFGDDARVLRTVYEWIRIFKNIDSRMQDQPFKWYRLQDVELPWVTGRFVMGVMTHAKNCDSVTEPPFTPTLRHAKWWGRIHLAIPDAAFHEVHLLAQQYVDRELDHEILGRPLHFNDLEDSMLDLIESVEREGITTTKSTT